MRALIRCASGIKKAQIQNSQQNEFKRGRGRVEAHASPGRVSGSREKDVHNMKACSQLSPYCLIKRGPNWVGVEGVRRVGHSGSRVWGLYGCRKLFQGQFKGSRIV